MKCNIEVLQTFKKEFKRLGKRYPSLLKDIEQLKEDIVENPLLGTDLGGGLRKIRMRIASKGKGKSSGARVITFTFIVSIEEAEVRLLFIYDKAERSNITKQELTELLERNGMLP